MKTKILGLLAVGLLAGPMGAHAVSAFTLIDPDQSVLRPVSGSTSVFYNGVLSLDANDTVFSVSLTVPGSLNTGIVSAFNPSTFSVVVSSFAPFGLYTGTYVLDFMNKDTRAPTGRVSVPWSLTVLDPNAVPEPGTLALLGLGLAGLSLARRRKAH